MANTSEVVVPDIGDFGDVEVIEVLVKPGDRLEVEGSVVTLESDKATMEIPSPVAGVVSELKTKVGDKVGQGDLLLLVVPDESAEPDAPATQAEPEPAAAPPPSVSAEPPVEASTPAARDAATGAFEIVEVSLPDLGDFHDVDVIELLVKPGDRIAAEESVLTLESEKATMEIPSPQAGVVKETKVAVGDKVNQGQLIMLLEVETQSSDADQVATTADLEESAELAPEPSVPTAPRVPAQPEVRAPGDKAPKPRPVIAKPSDAPIGGAHASPAVRRFARELGVDLMQVRGTAPKSRITKEDVQNFVKQSLSAGGAAAAASTGGVFPLPTAPEIDFGKFGEVETVELGRIKKLSGAHLHRSWLTVPHVTQFDEADITELESFRKAQRPTAEARSVKLTFVPFLMKAVAAAMRRYPHFNASLAPDGQNLILKKYLHLGVAVDTPNGLVVPVIRDVDQKGLFDLAGELGEISHKAREGRLAPGDMQGGCLSISSLGGIGRSQFVPIVNAPEVAILGISRATMKPVWDGEAFAPRLIMPFSLSYDHRVIDGVEGVRFTTYLGELLGDIRRLLL